MCVLMKCRERKKRYPPWTCSLHQLSTALARFASLRPFAQRHPRHSLPAQRTTDELAAESFCLFYWIFRHWRRPSSFSGPHHSPSETSQLPRRNPSLHGQPTLELPCQCRPRTLSVNSFSGTSAARVTLHWLEGFVDSTVLDPPALVLDRQRAQLFEVSRSGANLSLSPQLRQR